MNAMSMNAVYRILYCSRSALVGDPEDIRAEILAILQKSRVNNERDGITGGLFFSQQAFAQVLEGPAKPVEAAFERIQCDERHGEVIILEAGYVQGRDFPNWSMAFAGETDPSALSGVTLGAAFSGHTSAGGSVLALLRGVITREHEWLASIAA